MREMSYGWNIEMQMKAARAAAAHPGGADALSPPRRGGVSKVAGSLRGTLRAGGRIVHTFVRVALAR